VPERRFGLIERMRAAGLPPPDAATMAALLDIVDEGVLGASRHVGLSMDLVARLADEGPRGTAWRVAEETARFVAEVRGEGAPIVANALAWQTAGIAELPEGERAGALAARVDAWSTAARDRRDRLVRAAVAALADCRAPLVFDYSSTVSDIVVALAARGLERIVVPESRAIDGGRPYLRDFAALGVPLHVLPDAASEHAAALSDAMLIGAESVTADGGVVNTIGSVPHARAARAAGVPVYGAADLFKVGAIASADWPAPPLRRYPALEGEIAVDSRAPELEIVPPSLLTALLTEVGPVSPGELPARADRVEGRP